MNSIEGQQGRNKQYYFLSEILGARVTFKGKKLGKLSDFVVVDGDLMAEVSHLYVGRRFGDPPLAVPWDKVRSFSKKEISIDIESVDTYVADTKRHLLLLKDHILDKKVLDVEGKEVEVVYDIKLVMTGNKLYVAEVDFSLYGLLRRMRLRWLADFISNLSDSLKGHTITWKYVEPLPAELGSFEGHLRLKLLKERLSDMHPIDAADVLEQMDPEQRVAVFHGLDTGHASDTLEEIDPSAQRTILASLSKARIAQLVNEMTPGQAADVLAVLPSVEIEAILQLLDRERRLKVRDILEKHEQKILNYATSSFIKLLPETTVAQAHEIYRKSAAGSDVIMYLYVVDAGDRLLGVIDIRELMKADDRAFLRDIMGRIIATLSPTSTLREASAKFTRYGFRALPIVDETGRILGVVPYRDMMNLKQRFLE